MSRYATQMTRSMSMPWLVLLGSIALCSPWSIELSLGGDQVEIRVNRPSVGSPPSPPTAPNGESAPTGESLRAALPTLRAQTDAALGTASNTGTQKELSRGIANLQAEPADSSTTRSTTGRDAVESAGSDPNQAPRRETVELSVEPGTQPLLPTDRPAWVGAEPDYSGEIHRLFVGSHVVSDREDVDSALDTPLLAAVNAYISDQVLNEPFAAQRLNVDAKYIRRNLINDPQGVVLELNAQGRPMYQKWVAVQVTPTQRAQFAEWYREALQRERLVPLGLGLAAVVSLTGLFHLVLRRRHVQPSSQPLASKMFEQRAPANARARRWGGWLAPLLAVGGLLFLAAVILPSISVHHRVRRAAAHSEFVEDAAGTGRLNSEWQEFKFHSNGQEIVQKVQLRADTKSLTATAEAARGATAAASAKRSSAYRAFADSDERESRDEDEDRDEDYDEDRGED